MSGGLMSGGLMSGGLMSGWLKSAHQSKHIELKLYSVKGAELINTYGTSEIRNRACIPGLCSNAFASTNSNVAFALAFEFLIKEPPIVLLLLLLLLLLL